MRDFLTLQNTSQTGRRTPSTKVGCVVVGEDREVRSTGFNGFPRGIEDTAARLNDRSQVSNDLSRRRKCNPARLESVFHSKDCTICYLATLLTMRSFFDSSRRS